MSDKIQKSDKVEGTPAPGRIAELKAGTYSDGHPLDDVHYLECKIILKGDRFTSVDSFYEFAKIVKKAAESTDVDFFNEGLQGGRSRRCGK